jgi:uncharacterized protein
MAGPPFDRMIVRPCEPSDVAHLYHINEAATPGVGSVSRGAFDELITQAAIVLVVCGSVGSERLSAPLGFVLAMTEGLGYASPNYRWLSDRFHWFAYVDRIAVSPNCRGSGAGGQLYQAVIDHFSGRRPVLLAEVNLEPPNPGSIRFHERLGFRSIGKRWSADRATGVVYMALELGTT